MNATLAYLSCPYSHEDLKIREQRYEDACLTCARLVRKNFFVISPVVHWHPVALKHDLPSDWAFWAEYNTELIKKCDIFFILRLDGWKESQGVLAEMKIAKETHRMIDFLNAP